MKRIFTLLSCALLTVLAEGATPALVFRSDALPGARSYPAARKAEEITLPAGSEAAGTLTFWLRPEGWDNSDPAWHFFLRAGRHGKESAYIHLFRLPSGKTRLVWCRNDAKKQLTDIFADTPYRNGEWYHVALSWKNDSAGSVLKMYVNGRMISARRLKFTMQNDFPMKWFLGDVPTYTPYSKFSSRLGRIEFYKQALSDDEIASLAAQRYQNGRITVVNHKFVPGSVNRLEGVTTGGAAALEAVFVTESGKETLRRLPVAPRDGAFSVELVIPDNAVETRFTLLKKDGSSPVWKFTAIHYAEWLPPYLPDCWRADWISGPPLYRARQTRFFRRTFEADPAKLELAAFQWCCDNIAEVYLNGKSIGKVGSWAVPMVRTDLLPLLKPGKNIIAARCYNIGSNGGFFGELDLKGKDGKLTKIGTDGSWRYSQQQSSRWNMPDFDDSRWEFAQVLMRPPQLPYGMAPYRNFAALPTLKSAQPPLRLQATAGETVTIERRFPAPAAPIASPVTLSLSRPGGEIYRCDMSVRKAGGELIVSVPLVLPASAPGGRYTLSLSSRGAGFPGGGRIGDIVIRAGAPESPLETCVRSVAGKPVFFVNGKPAPVMFYRNPINFRHSTKENVFITPFDRAGVRISEINVSFKDFWLPDGSVNTAAVDRYLVSPLFYAPGSSFIISINTDAPRWYVDSHRSEWTKSESKANWLISYASEQYRRDAKEFLKKLLAYCKTLPLYNRIAGFGIDGGEDGQFMQWTGRNRDFLGDYSAPMQRYFRNALRKKYGTVAALNSAWKSSYASFDVIPLPSASRRMGSAEKLFLDPVKDADVVEYHRAYSDAAADFVLLCAETIKEATENKKIVTAYYGKFFTIAGYLEYGEFSIGRILRSPALDMLIAVEYNQRSTGNPHSLTAVAESYALHNKIFIDEADLRTFLSGAKNWAYAGTGFETVSMIRKMFLLTMTHGHGIHWYDLFGGIFENRAIMEGIGTVAEIQKRFLRAPKRPAEIAFIVDEESFLNTTASVKRLSASFLLGNQRGNWGRIGAPFDVWFAGDLADDRLPDYKMYVFTNVWSVSPKLAAAVKKLQSKGHLLVFLANSGMIANGSSGAENVAAFTGIRMKDAGALPLNLRLRPADLPGLKEVQYSSAGNVTPVMLPDDPSARMFGSLQNGRTPVMALKEFPAWKSLYSAVPVLTPAVWRSFARMAGVHIYSEDPDAMIYIGCGLFGVHTGTGGIKHLRFPRPVTLRDEVTGKTVLKKGKELALPMSAGETRIFSLMEK